MERILCSPRSPRTETIYFLFFVIRAEKRICWLNLPSGQGPKGQRLLNVWVTDDNGMLRVCLCTDTHGISKYPDLCHIKTKTGQY